MTLIVRFKGDLYEETPIVPTPSGPLVFFQDAWRDITEERFARSIQRIEPLPRPVPIQPGTLVARYYPHGSDKPPRRLSVIGVDLHSSQCYVMSDGAPVLAENAVEPGEKYGGEWPATETDDEASR